MRCGCCGTEVTETEATEGAETEATEGAETEATESAGTETTESTGQDKHEDAETRRALIGSLHPPAVARRPAAGVVERRRSGKQTPLQITGCLFSRSFSRHTARSAARLPD